MACRAYFFDVVERWREMCATKEEYRPDVEGVEITDAMIEAGVSELKSSIGDPDFVWSASDLAVQVYSAMEDARRASISRQKGRNL